MSSDNIDAEEEVEMDRDGYGIREGQSPLERLIEDCRTLSPAGIERVANGWDNRGSGSSFADAERAALHAVETASRGPEWDELRNRLLGLTERGQALISWRVEHGEVGHKAENALLAAALALIAGAELEALHAQTLVRPMSEALPWLATAVTSAG